MHSVHENILLCTGVAIYTIPTRSAGERYLVVRHVRQCPSLILLHSLCPFPGGVTMPFHVKSTCASFVATIPVNKGMREGRQKYLLGNVLYALFGDMATPKGNYWNDVFNESTTLRENFSLGACYWLPSARSNEVKAATVLGIIASLLAPLRCFSGS